MDSHFIRVSRKPNLREEMREKTPTHRQNKVVSVISDNSRAYQLSIVRRGRGYSIGFINLKIIYKSQTQIRFVATFLRWTVVQFGN